MSSLVTLAVISMMYIAFTSLNVGILYDLEDPNIPKHLVTVKRTMRTMVLIQHIMWTSFYCLVLYFFVSGYYMY